MVPASHATRSPWQSSHCRPSLGCPVCSMTTPILPSLVIWRLLSITVTAG